MPEQLPPSITERINATCVKFAKAWAKGARPSIQDHLGDSQGRQRNELFQSLLEIDLTCRRQAGESPSPLEYEETFPEHADQIKTLIEQGDIAPTLTQAPPGPSPNPASTLHAELEDTATFQQDAATTKTRSARPAQLSGLTFGDYVLLDEIARGGMGVVYKARQQKADRIVALKMILSGNLAGEAEIQRFYTEARAAANLDHPHIVPVFDVGEVNGQHYFSMGFVDGVSLADKLRDNPLEPKQAVELLCQIAEAVHYANEQQVIHRDLKPANILLDQDGRPKVTDFGLAKRFDEQQQLTMSGQVMGTPSYMSPEQAAGDSPNVGPQADVYSLGAILYQMLTGRPPFRAASTWETLTQVIEQEPVPPRQLNPSIDRDLDTIVLKSLEKDPAKRYPTAQALADDLRRYAEHRPIQARRISTWGRTIRWARRNKVVASLLCLLVLVSTSVVVGSVAAAVIFSQMAAEQARMTEEESRMAAEQAELREESDVARAEMRSTLYSAEMNLAGEAAATPSGIGRVRDLLEPWAPKAGAPMQPDLRGWEWYFLYALSHQERPENPVIQTGAEVFSVTDDGDGLLAIGNNRLLRLIDIKYIDTDGIEVVADWEAHEHRIDGLSFSPDRSRLASASFDGTVKIWNTQNDQLLKTLEHRDPKGKLQNVTDVMFHPGGKLIASHAIDVGADVNKAAERASLRIWDLATGKTRLHARERVDSLGTSLAFSPDGSLLAAPGFTTFSDFPVMVWDVESGERVLTMPDNNPRSPTQLPGHKEPIRSICFSPDGKRIATSGATLRIWNAQSPAAEVADRLLHTKSEHNTYVNAVAWSPDGRRLASGGNDYSIRVWDPDSGKQEEVLAGHANGVTVVHWVSDSRLVSGCASGEVRFWDVGQNSAVATLPVGVSRPQDGRIDHGDGYASLHWRPDGARLAASMGDWVRVWDAQRLQPLPPASGQKHLCWNHDGSRAASLRGDEIIIWDSNAAHVTKSFHINSQQQFDSWQLNPFAARLFWRPQSQTVVLADYKMMWEWDVDSDQPPRGTQRQGATTSAWRPDGRQVANANGHAELLLFAANSDAPLSRFTPVREEFDPPLSRAEHIDWHPHETLIATAHANHDVKIWDVTTWEEKVLQGHTFAVHQVAWSPDGSRLASGSGDKTVKIWDPAAGDVLLTLLHDAPVIAIDWAPDGQRLAALDAAGLVKIYDAAGGYRAAE